MMEEDEDDEEDEEEEDLGGATHGRPPWTERGSHSGQRERRDSGLMCAVGNEVEKCIAEVRIRTMQLRMVGNDGATRVVFVLLDRISWV